MEETKLIGFLLSVVSVAFWRWVSSIDKKTEKLNEETKELRERMNSLISKEDFLRELKEIKILIRELQKDIIRTKIKE